jgi:hypothetical protein
MRIGSLERRISTTGPPGSTRRNGSCVCLPWKMLLRSQVAIASIKACGILREVYNHVLHIQGALSMFAYPSTPHHSHHHKLCGAFIHGGKHVPTVFSSAETTMAALRRATRPLALHVCSTLRHLAHEAFQTCPSAPLHANG